MTTIFQGSVWRLIAHHQASDRAIEEMQRRGRIAIGWSLVGDLSQARIEKPTDIAALIQANRHPIKNAHLGGPSLWNLYKEMQVGDLVILNSNRRRVCVFEVLGPYIYETEAGEIVGYAHQRSACLTSIDPEDLWSHAGNGVAEGQNIRWTLARCSESNTTGTALYNEGLRFSLMSTVIERNPLARAACIEHYGCKCNICGFDFEKAFGELGNNYIHVHHHVAVSTRDGEYNVDPIEDLIPLCPNCHAMAHRQSPPVAVEKLRTIYKSIRISTTIDERI